MPLLYRSIEDVALEVESCMDEVNPVKSESLSPCHHRKLFVSYSCSKSFFSDSIYKSIALILIGVTKQKRSWKKKFLNWWKRTWLLPFLALEFMYESVEGDSNVDLLLPPVLLTPLDLVKDDPVAISQLLSSNLQNPEMNQTHLEIMNMNLNRSKLGNWKQRFQVSLVKEEWDWSVDRDYELKYSMIMKPICR